jgi:hypothetical protein
MGVPQHKTKDPYSANTSSKSRLKSVSRANKTYSQRINDDWGYLNEPKPSNHPTADETFNAAYKTKGLHPQSISDKKEAPDIELTERKSRRRQRAANDKSYNKSNVIKFPTKVSGIGKDIKSKAKATTVNLSILSWYVWLWLTQLMFGIIGLFMLGSVAAAEATVEKYAVFDWMSDAINSGTNLILGTTISEIGITFFMFTFVIIFAISIIATFITYIQYELALLRPLSGEHGSLKLVAFFITIIGSSAPIINIFPWLLVWMFAVWKYPR